MRSPVNPLSFPRVGFMRKLASTGMTVSDRTIEDKTATMIASGEKSLPSIPVRVAMGNSAMTIISTPMMIGSATSRAAR